jgi:RHS repeat-associated protein
MVAANANSNFSFDTMGRVVRKQSCIPGDCAYDVNVNATYDLAGNPLTTTNGSPVNPITLTYTYDGASHLATITSSLPVNSVSTLFQATSTSPAAYGPVGLLNASLGVDTSGVATINLKRSYDNRLHTVFEGDYNSGGTAQYTYCIPGSLNSNCTGSSGYQPNGNLAKVIDSATGTWMYTYDTLNRVATGTASSGPYNGQYGCWFYDAFGNRTSESMSTTPCTGTPPKLSWATYTTSNSNRMDSTSVNSNQISGYDAAGNITFDGLNNYLYDGEGRICGVQENVSGTIIQTVYVYDSAGNRVGEGTSTASPFSCSLSSSVFTVTKGFVVGLNGEQLTETDGARHWTHTNVFAGGKLLATYTGSNLYFGINDWLGTKRAEVGILPSCLSTYFSLPFGNGLSPSGNCSTDATEHHFTGKERDAESGLDYFPARYYGSNMGRWMSPDPLPWIEWQHGGEDDQNKFESWIANPQNLNLYAYVNNNPLSHTDPTGMNDCGTKDDSSCHVTITIQDRSKDKNGNYNDQYAGLKGNGSYNATATVSINGKDTGQTFLVDTVSSGDGKFATIQNGTYDGVLHNHHGDPNKPSIELMLDGSNHIPTTGPNVAQGGASFATDVLLHPAGGLNSNPLGYTGLLPNGHGVSEACQLICTTQYGRFLTTTGIRPIDGSAPQQHFSVVLNSSANQ